MINRFALIRRTLPVLLCAGLMTAGLAGCVHVNVTTTSDDADSSDTGSAYTETAGSDIDQVPDIMDGGEGAISMEFTASTDYYIVTMPGKPMDICVEAISQGNCLMEYADRHADGETTILFLRKACAPDTPYVTLEVRDWQVTQVYARFNMPPPVEVYTFLEKYARRNWLYFNPYQVIMEACDEIDPDDWDSGLLNYAEAYRRRNRAFSFIHI